MMVKRISLVKMYVKTMTSSGNLEHLRILGIHMNTTRDGRGRAIRQFLTSIDTPFKAPKFLYIRMG